MDRGKSYFRKQWHTWIISKEKVILFLDVVKNSDLETFTKSCFLKIEFFAFLMEVTDIEFLYLWF